jgi:hypothetical protein
MTGQNSGPLSGTRVVDLTRILAGPLCTMMLGDMGADVIKVEPPGTGDDTRGWGPPFAAGEAAYFLGVNRNKRSLTINLAAAPGQKILAGLIEKADVLIDNFKLGTLEKWGFGDAWFEGHAPKVVRCGITGYGSSGPKAAQPGYDFILQAESGLMSICGEQDGVPTKYGVAIVDVCTGMLACNSILAGQRRFQCARLRQGRQPVRQRPSEHCALYDLSRRRRHDGAGGRQRRPVRADRRGARPSGMGERSPLQGQSGPRREPRRDRRIGRRSARPR